MKTKTLILFSILIFQIFSPFAAQTLAQTTANIDFNDSDDFSKIPFVARVRCATIHRKSKHYCGK